MAFNTGSGSGSDREAMSEINVTPLVYVMLVLLVVFIVTVPLLTQAVRVDLPQTEKTDTPPDKHIATVSIDIDLAKAKQKEAYLAYEKAVEVMPVLFMRAKLRLFVI